MRIFPLAKPPQPVATILRAVLRPDEDASTTPLNRALFYKGVAHSLFNNTLRQSQVKGMDAILDAWAQSPYTDVRWLAYMLATAYHETAMAMQPSREYGSNEYLRLKYDVTGHQPERAKLMGNTQPGDGVKFAGRGLIPLTWKNNYRKASDKLGIDLVTDPDRALECPIATRILLEGMVDGWFTGRKLADDFADHQTDWTNARCIVNQTTDRAERVGCIARHFYAAIMAANQSA